MNGETYRLWAKVAHHLDRLENGFVIFRESYVKSIELFLQKNAPTLSGLIRWDRVAQEALTAP